VITDEQKQQLDAMFKFKVGDVVRIAHIDPSGHGERRIIVTERFLTQCPGGVQLFYSGRLFDRNGVCGTDWTKYLEIELEASGPFEPILWETEARKISQVLGGLKKKQDEA
jgi:hypothetical protein